MAACLKNAIEKSMMVLDSISTGSFRTRGRTWVLRVEADENHTEIPLRLYKIGASWKASLVELEAIVGLATWSTYKRLRFLSGNAEPPACIRVIGGASGLKACEALLNYQTYVQRSSEAQFMNVHLLNPFIGCSTGSDRESADSTSCDDTAADSETTVLGVKSERPIVNLIAQTLYIKFLSASLWYFSSIGGAFNLTMQRRNYDNRYRLRNTHVTRLARAFEDSGLGSEEEAHLCIVLELVRQQKLCSYEIGGLPEWNGNGRAESTLVHFARNGNEGDLLSLLHSAIDEDIDEGWMQLALVSAVQMNQMGSIRAILRYRPDTDRRAAIFNAAKIGRVEAMELLLQRNVQDNTEIEARNEHGETVLFAAVRSGNLSILKMLLDKGANVEAEALDRTTPLSVAVAHGYVESARLLLDRNAINEKNKTDHPLLWTAGRKGDVEMVELLLARGARVVEEDLGGPTILTFATEAGD